MKLPQGAWRALPLLLLLTACAAPPVPPPKPAAPAACPVCPPVPAPPPKPAPPPSLRPVDWSQLPGWPGEAPAAAWPALLRSCAALGVRPEWAQACRLAGEVDGYSDAAVAHFLQDRFVPYQVVNGDGSTQGLVTGYYEPVIAGDDHATARARYPIYATPDNLLIVDLASVYPELKHMRLRGRLVGNKVVPYYSRAQIADDSGGFSAPVLAWADNAVDLFFLQIQGSGWVRFPDGREIHVGYAQQNGYPYRAVGRVLAEWGELPLDKVSMQNIKRWGEEHPEKLPQLLDSNPSYVFFKRLPDDIPGPYGALGVPLTPERSIAVDARYLPLGAPVYLATTRPLSDAPLDRLVLAQDTGGAIRGGVRADYFWGTGKTAGELAGRMKQQGQMWVLLPRGYMPASVTKVSTPAQALK